MESAHTFNVVAASLATSAWEGSGRRCWWEVKLHAAMSSSSFGSAGVEACGAEVGRDHHAAAKLVVEAWPQEIAKDKALTETVCAKAAATAVEGPVVQARPLGISQYSACRCFSSRNACW